MMHLKSIFSSILFLLIGIVCIYFSFRNQNIHSLIKTIQSINYFWYLPVLLCTIICHIARTKRWQLLLDQNEYKSDTFTTYNAIMSAYLVNFATGKLGEIYRCGILRKENDIPFTYSLATVFIERVFDVLSLLILFIFTALFNYKIIYSFYQKYIEAQFTQTSFNILILLLFVFLVSICILYFYRQMILSYFNNKFSAFYSGLKSIFQMKEKKNISFLYTSYLAYVFIDDLFLVFCIRRCSFIYSYCSFSNSNRWYRKVIACAGTRIRHLSFMCIFCTLSHACK